MYRRVHLRERQRLILAERPERKKRRKAKVEDPRQQRW